MNFKVKIENCKKAKLGEGPLWDDENNILYYIDIEGMNIRKYDPESEKEELMSLNQRVGSIFLSKDGRLLAALEDGIYYTDTMKMAHEKISLKGFRFNDGKVGPDGCIYVGTMSETSDGALYKITPKGEIIELLDNISTSNGLDWSIDEKTFYYIDTPTQKIVAFDFDDEISNKRTIYEVDKNEGKPDGMCIDSKGILHVALWSGRAFISIDPITGNRIAKTPTSAMQTSCVAFGGKDMKTMYITTANVGNDDLLSEELAGQLLSLEYDVAGRTCYRFG
jgi:sugar lactone lactonase YvrE